MRVFNPNVYACTMLVLSVIFGFFSMRLSDRYGDLESSLQLLTDCSTALCNELRKMVQDSRTARELIETAMASGRPLRFFDYDIAGNAMRAEHRAERDIVNRIGLDRPTPSFLSWTTHSVERTRE